VDLELVVRNRQRLRRVEGRLIRELARWLLTEVFPPAPAELGIHLVGDAEMTRVNWQFLQHEGSTDVITFDHRDPDEAEGPGWNGELFICVAEAVRQAAAFGTSWEQEVARYVIHGVLHLAGHDDHDPARRRVMKREENRLVRQAVRRFAIPVPALPAGRRRRATRK